MKADAMPCPVLRLRIAMPRQNSCAIDASTNPHMPKQMIGPYFLLTMANPRSR